MRFLRGLGIATAAVLAMSSASNADFQIDDFQTAQNVTVTNGGANPKTASGSIIDGVVGGEREMKVVRTTGNRTLQGDAFNGTFAYLSSSGVDGSVTLTYDGIGNVGLGGVDILDPSDPNNTQFILTNAESDSGLHVHVFIYRDATHFAEGLISITPGTQGSPYNAFQLLSTFTLNGAGSTFNNIFTDVNSIVLRVEGQQLASDGQFGLIVTGIVPEPSSLALLGVGFLGTGFAAYGRRKMAKNA